MFTFEWKTIEKGLQQRSEVLNLLLKDIYGKRELIKKGIIPYEVIFAHKGFLRACDQIQYKTAKQLLGVVKALIFFNSDSEIMDFKSA